MTMQSVEIDVVLKYSLPLPGGPTSDSNVRGDSSSGSGSDGRECKYN
jgi:hypothetical protein